MDCLGLTDILVFLCKCEILQDFDRLTNDAACSNVLMLQTRVNRGNITHSFDDGSQEVKNGKAISSSLKQVDSRTTSSRKLSIACATLLP